MKIHTRNKVISIGIIILAVIAAGVWAYAAFVAKRTEPVTQQPNVDSSQAAPDSQESVKPEGKYAELTGDAFDEIYIADMLAHHEGAVNMAEQAQAVTAHEEIRTMAAEITYAQSVEMFNMTEWQKAWGYDPTMGEGHNSHGGDGTTMAGDMVEMQNELKDLTGEAYDKEFLKQMILHHQQAVEMSENAATNAKHQEVKDLAEAVIRDQTSEIAQMKQWQKDWGYQ